MNHSISSRRKTRWNFNFTRMLRIGITGGIGSGKTMVCKIFQVLGIPVYHADIAARKLMESDPELINSIRDHFGNESYLPDGKLNRKFIADIVFKNADQLKQLNTLVHPATIHDAEKWMQQQTTKYAIKEAALLFESAAFHYLDKIILVHAPYALRLQRAMQRDQLSKDEVIKRMQQQIDEDIKLKLADFIIYNDEQQAVIPQVLYLHEQLLQLEKATASLTGFKNL